MIHDQAENCRLTPEESCKLAHDPVRVVTVMPLQDHTLKAPNYRQRKKQREDAKRKSNEEKSQRKGRVPRPETQQPPA
jgi:hypothetical protein